MKLDLHMHTTVSDGTNTPQQIARIVREAGIGLFSITDHDAIKGACEIAGELTAGDPGFITGVEFSCKDSEGKYHILGYGYDPQGRSINDLVEMGHSYRVDKVYARIDFLEKEFGFTFPEEKLGWLFAQDNPGKPHIGNMMVEEGFAKSKEDAINNYLNKLTYRGKYVKPEEAIEGILKSGGIPILAHPSYGDGDQLILGEDMDKRLNRLMEMGIKGIEAFYSGFTPRINKELLGLADKYSLYVTAGSDYHGKNKLVILGDTGLDNHEDGPEGMKKFLEDVRYSTVK